MAQDKKSFIAYSDWDGMFQALPNEVAGKLIKHIFAYVNDKNPESDDYIINALFEQVKSTLKRDLVKWEQQREQRSLAGKRSAENRQTKSNERSTSVNESERKSTVSVSVSDSVKVKENTVPKTELEQTFESYIEMRKKIKKPATEHAIELVKKKLDELSKCNEPLKIKILNQSIVNCWQDIYELKQPQQGNKFQPIQQTKTYKNLD